MKIFPGQSVVVMGLGVTGQVHVQLAKAWGAYPGDRDHAQRLEAETSREQLGADLTFPAAPEAVRGVMEATGGHGADMVIECTGVSRRARRRDQHGAAGRHVAAVRNHCRRRKPTLPFYQLYYKELNVVNTRAAKGEDYPPIPLIW